MRTFFLSTFQVSFDHGPPQPPRVPVYLSFEHEGCTGPSLNSFSVQWRVQPLVIVLVPCRSLTTTHDPLSFRDEHVAHFIQMYKYIIHTHTHTHTQELHDATQTFCTCALPEAIFCVSIEKIFKQRTFHRIHRKSCIYYYYFVGFTGELLFFSSAIDSSIRTPRR